MTPVCCTGVLIVARLDFTCEKAQCILDVPIREPWPALDMRPIGDAAYGQHAVRVAYRSREGDDGEVAVAHRDLGKCVTGAGAREWKAHGFDHFGRLARRGQ